MPEKMFTMDDIESCWPYALDYFLQVLNGEYTVEDSRNDLKSLIGSKYDPRIKQNDQHHLEQHNQKGTE